MGLSSRSGTRGGWVLRGWQGKGGKFWLGNIKKGEKCEKSGHRLEFYLGIKMAHTEMGFAGVNWMQAASGDELCV